MENEIIIFRKQIYKFIFILCFIIINVFTSKLKLLDCLIRVPLVFLISDYQIIICFGLTIYWIHFCLEFILWLVLRISCLKQIGTCFLSIWFSGMLIMSYSNYHFKPNIQMIILVWFFFQTYSYMQSVEVLSHFSLIW